MHPLDGPRLKIRRAISEIQALRLAEEAFRSASDYKAVRAEFNPKSGNHVYRVQVNVKPSLEWGVWIGEIAHNLRSSLDGLVYRLALLETKTPALNTQFPVFLVGTTTRKRRPNRNILIPHFEGMEFGHGRSMIRQLRPEHQTMIERLQPYKRGRGGRNSPLHWLKEINNADKHRLIQVVGSKLGIGPFIGTWGDVQPTPRRFPNFRLILKDGAKLGELPPNVHVAPKLIPLVAFWVGCPPVQGKAVVNTLRIISEHVSQIIEDFSSEF